MKKSHITLQESEINKLNDLLSKGSLKAKKFKRIIALQELNKGKTQVEVAKIVDVSLTTINKWCKKYEAEGLAFLDDQQRPGRPAEFSSEDKAKVTALACTTPPEGHAKWSLRLLADKIIELKLVEEISHTQVGTILKKMN